MTNEAGEERAERVRVAFDRIADWMNTHRAPLLVENLAPGATPARLAQAETEFGVALLPTYARSGPCTTVSERRVMGSPDAKVASPFLC